MTADSKKKGHGGARPGAGRPKRGDYEEVKSASQILRAKAREHGPAALQALIDVATSGRQERARISAANALLDRGYGRPAQIVDNTSSDGTMSPNKQYTEEELKQEMERRGLPTGILEE